MSKLASHAAHSVFLLCAFSSWDLKSQEYSKIIYKHLTQEQSEILNQRQNIYDNLN